MAIREETERQRRKKERRDLNGIRAVRPDDNRVVKAFRGELGKERRKQTGN
jgi:hypothetical protein